jgi:hypothetical protein
MSRLIYFGIIVIFAMSGFSSSSFSEVRNFDNPEYEGYSLDWCRSWGKSVASKLLILGVNEKAI